MKKNKIERLLKLILMISFYFLTLRNSDAQIDFESQIQSIANDIAQKLDTLHHIRILAVSDFVCEDGKVSDLGKTIAEELAIDLTNAGKNFKIVDRQDLALILKEHKLASTGVLNSDEVKQLGKFHVADAIITGRLSLFGDYVKVNVKVMGTENALIIAGVNKSLSNTDAIKNLFNCASVTKSQPQKEVIGDPISETAVNVNSSNSQGSSSNDCAIKKKGDYSFVNKTSEKIQVQIDANQNDLTGQNPYSYSSNSGTKLIILPGETQYAYQIGSGPHRYRIWKLRGIGLDEYYGEGNINVTICGNGTYNVR